MDVLKTISVNLACGLIGAQLYDQAAALSRWLIGWAARRLGRDVCERFHEEWLSHLNDCYGNLAKLWHALGCVVASLRLNPPLVSKIRSSFSRLKVFGLQIVAVLILVLVVREFGKIVRANAGVADAEKFVIGFVALIIAAVILRGGKNERPALGAP
jgi:hypothetical protein